MTTLVYRTYSQEALDDAYNNRTKVTAAYFDAFSARCREASEEARRRWPCHLDISYGAARAERLDIFVNPARVGGPVNVFFHGGYWRANDKTDFAYVANGLLPAHSAVVIAEYGLIPSVTMDELIAQCRAAVAWVFRHIATYGADSRQIYLSGHSAGAHIVAMLLTTDWTSYQVELPANVIKGAVGISGIYDLEPIRLCFINSTLNLSPSIASRNSPIKLKPTYNAPLFLAVGDREGEEYLRQSAELASAWSSGQYDPTLYVQREADHYLMRELLNQPKSDLVAMMTRSMFG